MTTTARKCRSSGDHMPLGSVGNGRYGTCFIGYARSPDPIEEMLVNMFKIGSLKGAPGDG